MGHRGHEKLRQAKSLADGGAWHKEVQRSCWQVADTKRSGSWRKGPTVWTEVSQSMEGSG